MEQHGAVFLPAAGYRDGTSVGYVGSYVDYWSASYSNSIGAYDLFFKDGTLPYDYGEGYNRNSGLSVRLVAPPAEN